MTYRCYGANCLTTEVRKAEFRGRLGGQGPGPHISGALTKFHFKETKCDSKCLKIVYEIFLLDFLSTSQICENNQDIVLEILEEISVE